jgi:predicted nucleotidyltransferase component of viral defense system
MNFNNDLVINSFLDFLKIKKHDLILKGGAALKYCYNSTRLTKDLDFDGINNDNISLIEEFCNNNNYDLFFKKNTEITQRCSILYNQNIEPLKIEISYRDKNIDTNNITMINGIKVYVIAKLFASKLPAFQNRDKLRDLFDICFIYKNYKESLSICQIELLKESLTTKNFAYFDYIIETQKNEPENKHINIDELANDYLDMYNDLGLLHDTDEKQIIKNNYNIMIND